MEEAKSRGLRWSDHGPGRGYGRGELNYQQLPDDQQEEADQAMIKALDIHFEYEAVAPVPVGNAIDKSQSVPSRMVLTNKADSDEPDGFVAKGRWCCGGQHDPEGGLHETTSPTAQNLGHQLLLTVAVLVGWKLRHWHSSPKRAVRDDQELVVVASGHRAPGVLEWPSHEHVDTPSARRRCRQPPKRARQ